MTFSRRVGEIAAANSKSTVPQSSSSDPHIDIFLLDVEKGIIRSSKTTLLGSLAIHVRNAVISTVNTRNLSDPIPPATIDRWQPSTVVAKYILRNQDWNTKCLTRCGSTADAFAAGICPHRSVVGKFVACSPMRLESQCGTYRARAQYWTEYCYFRICQRTSSSPGSPA